jgi:hypothetical protein
MYALTASRLMCAQKLGISGGRGKELLGYGVGGEELFPFPFTV